MVHSAESKGAIMHGRRQYIKISMQTLIKMPWKSERGVPDKGQLPVRASSGTGFNKF
jgi:hypothetical protein